MLVRLVVFALHADENLSFGKGLSSPDEPDIWQKDLTGQIEHWIDIGQPSEKRIRQACGKASTVSIYSFQKGAALPWFEEVNNSLERFKHLKIFLLENLDDKIAAKLLNRTMSLNFTIDQNQIQISDTSNHVVVDLKCLKS